jgi:hypothetical protein
MKRTFALLTGATIALGWLAIVPDANARVRYFGPYGYYYGGPYNYYYGGPSFGGSPMFAPDRPAPRRYNNPGHLDFQDGSRG